MAAVTKTGLRLFVNTQRICALSQEIRFSRYKSAVSLLPIGKPNRNPQRITYHSSVEILLCLLEPSIEKRLERRTTYESMENGSRAGKICLYHRSSPCLDAFSAFCGKAIKYNNKIMTISKHTIFFIS